VASGLVALGASMLRLAYAGGGPRCGGSPGNAGAGRHGRRCARCSLRRRTRELLSAGTGTISPQLAGVSDAMTAARQPRSALNWLRKGAGASLLADVAASRLAVSHDALDAHPHQPPRSGLLRSAARSSREPVPPRAARHHPDTS
jgi:hypothetical protein